MKNSDIHIYFPLLGGIELTTIYKGHRVAQKYMGYNLSECKRLFKQYIKTL